MHAPLTSTARRAATAPYRQAVSMHETEESTQSKTDKMICRLAEYFGAVALMLGVYLNVIRYTTGNLGLTTKVFMAYGVSIALSLLVMQRTNESGQRYVHATFVTVIIFAMAMMVLRSGQL
jgi:vacuolar-type H+-ATPase subunit I/STV1